ncbi:MAG: tRNA threonylcarbamoyladenosine dehydratase [Kiritimatiellae bacterium]|nr:tRNA threonylcarbamoyladenosine dehydratase [Kiritimatiellia bacterium]MDW8457960.1 tRNA threonylcarbamoyladenosine dehydratase [Verrucomicrobiota bacterium]
MARLQAARVLVVGLGGVGSWAAEALARSGIGHLTLMDGDDICVSNTNRQLHAVADWIGRPKAEALASRILAINPECRVRARREFYLTGNPERPFDEPLDVVVDCIDGVMSKATLIGSARSRGISVITCGGAAGKLDPSLVRTDDLAHAHHDRLLMFVRKKLRRHFGLPGGGNRKMGVLCVYSPEPVKMPDPCDAEKTVSGIDPNSGPVCEGRLGSAVFVTAVFGFHAAAAAVRLLLGNQAPNHSAKLAST